MIFVDSSVWIDYFNGTGSAQTDLLDAALGRVKIVVGDLVLAEVLQGFRRDDDYRAAKKALTEFDIRELLGETRALSAVDKYRQLRKTGTTIRKTNDVIIASYCIDEKIPLLYSDRDFNPFVSELGLVAVDSD